MPISPNTESSPSGSAGEGGLKAAFDSAVADVGMPDETFHPAAGDPEPEVEEPESTDEGKEPEPAPEAKPVAKPAKAKANGKEQTAAPAVDPTLAAPANWDATRKAAFEKLPPEGKKVLLDMSKGLEAEYGKKTTQLADAARYAQSVHQIITPEHRQQMRAAGLQTDSEGIARLIELNDAATRDFPGYARWAMEQYAGDAPIADVLRQIFPDAFTGSDPAQPGAQAPRPQVDPYIKQVYDRLQQVSQRLDGFDQQSKAEKEAMAGEVIEDFRNEADANGNKLHPHLARLEPAVVQVLLSDPDLGHIRNFRTKLLRAYEKAVEKDQETLAPYLESEVSKRLAEKQKADDLAKARKARAPINAAPSGPAGKPAKGIDGALTQAMRLHGL